MNQPPHPAIAAATNSFPPSPLLSSLISEMTPGRSAHIFLSSVIARSTRLREACLPVEEFVSLWLSSTLVAAGRGWGEARQPGAAAEPGDEGQSRELVRRVAESCKHVSEHRRVELLARVRAVGARADARSLAYGKDIGKTRLRIASRRVAQRTP